VKRLNGTAYDSAADRIEARHLLVAGAISGGHLRVKHSRLSNLDAVIANCRRLEPA